MVYATLSATPFKKPLNPSPSRTIPPTATSIKNTDIWYKLTLEIELYLLHTNMEKALKQQLIGVT